MSLSKPNSRFATEFRNWFYREPNGPLRKGPPFGGLPFPSQPAGADGTPALIGEPGGVRVDYAPVELGEGELRAVGFALSPGRVSREYFGGAVLEHDLDVYLVGRAEDDPRDADGWVVGPPDRLRGVRSMEFVLDPLDGFAGILPKGREPDGSTGVKPKTQVLSCTFEGSAITSSEDLDSVIASFEYTLFVRR